MNPPNTPVDSIPSPIPKTAQSASTARPPSGHFTNVFTAFSVKKLVPAIFRKPSSKELKIDLKEEGKVSSPVEKSELGYSLNLDDFSPALLDIQKNQTFDLEENIIKAELRLMSREDSRTSSAAPELSIKSSLESYEIPQSTRVEASNSVTVDLDLEIDPGMPLIDRLSNYEGSSETKFPSSSILEHEISAIEHSPYQDNSDENNSGYLMNIPTPPNTQATSRNDNPSETEKEPDYNYFKDLSVSSSFLSPIDTTTIQAIPIESSSYDINFINYTSNTVSLSITSEMPSFIRTEPSSRSSGNEDIEFEVLAVLNQIIEKVVEVKKTESQAYSSIALEEPPTTKKDPSKENLHVKFYIDQNDDSIGDSELEQSEASSAKITSNYHIHFWKFIAFGAFVGFAIFSVFIDQSYNRMILRRPTVVHFRPKHHFPHPIPEANIQSRSEFIVSEVFTINDSDFLRTEVISEELLQPQWEVKPQNNLTSNNTQQSIIGNIGKKIQLKCKRIQKIFAEITNYIFLRFCRVPFIGKRVCS